MKTLLAMMAFAFLAPSAPTVSGTWTMMVDSPHGVMTTALILNDDSGTVTGTFTSGGHMPDMAVNGTFRNGTLKLEANSEDHGTITFTATLQDDGTLSGSLSVTEVGDMNWTAKRTDSKDKL